MSETSRLRKARLGIVASLAVALLAAVVGWRWFARAEMTGQTSAPAPPVATRAVRAEIAIEGMDCLMCAAGLQNKLRALRGVAQAEVSYQDKRATVEFDPALIDRTQLVEAIRSDGLKVAEPKSQP